MESAKLMAEMHGISLDDIKPRKIDKIYRATKKLKKSILDCVFIFRWILGFKDSTLLNVNNIDEASIVLSVLSKINMKYKYETTFRVLIDKIKKR